MQEMSVTKPFKNSNSNTNNNSRNCSENMENASIQNENYGFFYYI